MLKRKKWKQFTIGCCKETLVVATSLAGEIFSDVHMCMHFIPYLIQGCIEVSLPVLLVQTIYDLSQLDLQKGQFGRIQVN